MPQCVVCNKLFHPDWVIETEIRGDMVKSCMFCKLDKNELTVVDESDKLVEIVNKEQASVNYKRYLDDLSKKPRIAEILVKAKNESNGKRGGAER